MTAIFGVLADAKSSEQQAMLEALGSGSESWPHERIGQWNDQRFAVGIQARSNTPGFERDGQPLVCHDTGQVLVCDARLDNRDELAGRLGLDPSRSSLPDSRLILEAFRRWGLDAPGHLRGDYVLALWDPRDRRLALVRDPLGVRQLYWFKSGARLAFASSLQGLLALDWAPRLLDEVWLAGTLQRSLLSEEPWRTPVASVRRLRQGTCLVCERGGEPRQSHFWTPDLSIRRESDQAFEEEFRELFRRSVRARLRSAFPVASTLSGDLDSSAVSTVAASQADADQLPIRTVTARFPTQAEPASGTEQSRLVADVNRRQSLSPLTVNVDELSPLFFERELQDALAAPSFSPDSSIDWALCRACADAGCRTLLTGVGGETTISHGFGALPSYFRTLRWLALWREVRALQQRHPSFAVPAQRILWGAVLRPQLNAWFPTAFVRWRATRYRQGGGWFPAQMLAPELARRIRFSERRVEALLPRDRDELSWFGLDPVVFAAQTHDSVASSHGIEVRHPFLDQDLIEFCLRLPHDQRLRDGWTRWILRSSLSAELPDSVRQGFGNKAHGTNGRIRLSSPSGAEELTRRLKPLPEELRPFLDQASVSLYLQRLLTAPPDRGSEAAYAAVHSVGALAEWLQRNPLKLSW
ncbi:MAG: hypothetical protein DWQ36_06320 [Acidobacteria bacterium]|nr:MAG: hypothetical protein DWQ30_19325 [Acidobacteriota bacterium]REK09660.1 MAG: hypothetical protein DWQ36_06320 [Acidobacteriota bacterium]